MSKICFGRDVGRNNKPIYFREGGGTSELVPSQGGPLENIDKIFRRIKNVFLISQPKHILYDYLKEPSLWDGSF